MEENFALSFQFAYCKKKLKVYYTRGLMSPRFGYYFLFLFQLSRSSDLTKINKKQNKTNAMKIFCGANLKRYQKNKINELLIQRIAPLLRTQCITSRTWIYNVCCISYDCLSLLLVITSINA